jgi:hypothetical protein
MPVELSLQIFGKKYTYAKIAQICYLFASKYINPTSMIETEISQAITRYLFLVELLNTINEKINEALKNDRRWFAFAPKICIKFLNQAFTLQLLFSDKQLEVSGRPSQPFEDLSAIYSTLRMQFETHALFYHLFIPCNDIEENILRFRLWELDGMRSRITINAGSTQTLSAKMIADQNYQQVIEQTIINLPYYQALDAKTQKFLLDRAVWRFTDAGLAAKAFKPISYDQLIRQTGINETVYADVYAYLSMHTHPSYVGIVQSFSSTDEETSKGRYVAIIHASFVTAFMIEDLSARFVQGSEHLRSLSEFDMSVYKSVRDGGRIK